MRGHCEGDAKKGYDYTGAQLETKLYISPYYQELSDICENILLMSIKVTPRKEVKKFTRKGSIQSKEDLVDF